MDRSGTWEGTANGRVVGAHKGTHLVFVVIDALSEIAGSPRAETRGQQVAILSEHDLGSAAKADLLSQSVSIDQVGAHSLGEHLCHMLGRARVVEHTSQVGTTREVVPPSPVVDAAGLHSQQCDA